MADNCRANDQIILEKLDSFTSLNEAQHLALHDKLSSIDEQVKKTNGRVSKLEEWKNKILGGLVFSQLLLLPVTISLIVWALTKR